MTEPDAIVGRPSAPSVSHLSSPGHSTDSVPELAISHWWRFASLNEPLSTTCGRQVAIVFRGVWSHGMGPDFREAMIAFENAELRSGSIEIHRKSSDWYHHGHDRDPAYNDVVLHVVIQHDRDPTRRLDGNTVPVVVIPDVSIDEMAGAQGAWSLVGGDVCAADLVASHRELLRAAVHELGDRRLGGKSARLEAQLASREPGEVLHEELLDGLGFSANRDPMRAIARFVPLHALESLLPAIAPQERVWVGSAALLGAAGFLPMSPHLQDAAGIPGDDLGRIESFWRSHCMAWHPHQMSPSSWNFARVRPANHPIRRLLAAALIIARSPGGLLFELLDAIRAETRIEELLVSRSTWNEHRLLGEGRARAIAASSVIPFAMALAAHGGYDDLALASSRAWELLPGEEPNQSTRRAIRQIAGRSSLGSWGARGMQGLIHLDTTLCAPRRCFECPIARIVVEHRP